MPGKFIVFEGLDGSGETTQANMLSAYLSGKGLRVEMGKEPTEESSAGREILEVLSHKKTMDARKLQELFVEDRKEHLKNQILPALEADAAVIEDRYILSTLAFGSIECPLDWLWAMNKDLPWPDITFILKVRPETSLTRIDKRGKPRELFEKEEKLRKVAETYDKLALAHPRSFVVDGEQAPEKVHEDIVKILTRELGI